MHILAWISRRLSGYKVNTGMIKVEFYAKQGHVAFASIGCASYLCCAKWYMPSRYIPTSIYTYILVYILLVFTIGSFSVFIRCVSMLLIQYCERNWLHTALKQKVFSCFVHAPAADSSCFRAKAL